MTNAIANLTIQEWASVAQVMATLVTFIGVLGSLWLSVKALREVQTDRKLRQRPHLAFETGGWKLPVEFVMAGKRIPGVNPAYVEQAFASLPNNAESIRLLDRKSQSGKPIFYGQLKNFGSGPALLTHITWIPKVVWIGSEKFVLDDKKLSEPLYSGPLNRIPSCPSHIAPSAEAELSRLPTFIEKDFEKKITRVEGNLLIECQDVFAETLSIRQKFYLFTNYKENPPSVHITFGDLLLEKNKADA
jgi:hypothetical protein